jgi:hypothetical protein
MKTGPIRRWRAVCVGLAIAPCLWSLVVHAAFPSRPQRLEPAKRPALALDQYLVDLGKIQPTTEVHGTFVFENRGTETVVIDDVLPSCGCLQPRLSAKELPPGETGAVMLRMQPANETPGRKSYTADIRYRDPEPREVRVTFRVEVPERQMSVKPRALIVYQLSDQPTQHELIVTDTRESPAEVTKITANSPHIAADLIETTDHPEQGRTIRIQVTVAKDVPAGRSEALLTLETTDALSPVLRVPVLLQGRREDR